MRICKKAPGNSDKNFIHLIVAFHVITSDLRCVHCCRIYVCVSSPHCTCPVILSSPCILTCASFLLLYREDEETNEAGEGRRSFMGRNVDRIFLLLLLLLPSSFFSLLPSFFPRMKRCHTSQCIAKFTLLAIFLAYVATYHFLQRLGTVNVYSKKQLNFSKFFWPFYGKIFHFHISFGKSLRPVMSSFANFFS